MKVYIGDRLFNIRINPSYTNQDKPTVPNFNIRCFRDYREPFWNGVIITHILYREFYRKEFGQKDKSVIIEVEDLIKGFEKIFQKTLVTGISLILN